MNRCAEEEEEEEAGAPCAPPRGAPKAEEEDVDGTAPPRKCASVVASGLYEGNIDDISLRR
jgi:hypothetical protein